MKWVFEFPRVMFDRDWALGRVVFRPPGAVAGQVAAREAQTAVHPSWANAYQVSTDVVQRWEGSSTVQVQADSQEQAQAVVAEAMAVLRFLLREAVVVNVDFHRIGLVGEVDHVAREYLVLYGNDQVAAGWTLVDSAVPFRFTDDQLAQWDNDQRVRWLSNILSESVGTRSQPGPRVVTALQTLDRAFLSRNPVDQVVLNALAVEVLFSDTEDNVRPPNTKTLRMAGRVAYLTCPGRCAQARPACPYVLGFKDYQSVMTTAKHWASRNQEWRCSAFLNIARPWRMNSAFMRPSVFAARNEAVHEGRTTLDESDIRWLRTCAESAVRAFLEWASDRPGSTVDDLDEEIWEGAAELDMMTPST